MDKTAGEKNKRPAVDAQVGVLLEYTIYFWKLCYMLSSIVCRIQTTSRTMMQFSLIDSIFNSQCSKCKYYYDYID